MKVKVYVNYDKQETLSEADFNKCKEEAIAERYKCPDEDSFSEWFGEEFYDSEFGIINDTENFVARVKEAWAKQAKAEIEEEFDDDWIEEEIEI